MDAAEFLDVIAGEGKLTFQTFDDTARKDRTLSRILHGSLAEHASTLAALNAKGAGIFFMANQGDCQGRSAANVRRVRALFVDLDGSPVEHVHSAPLAAHAVIESSPGRWHAYWLVSNCPLDSFKTMQQALAKRFHGDPKVCDLPRVMRLPGFDHRKRTPFRTRIERINEWLPYRIEQIVEALELAPSAASDAPRRVLPDAIPAGERNHVLLSAAAGFVRRGYDLRATAQRLQRINAERCKPPLDAREVDVIVARALTYGSSGHIHLTHALLDSAEWKSLSPIAHEIVLVALRRFDGGNNGNISLVWEELSGLPGFGNKQTFYACRASAVDAGILTLTTAGGNKRSGRKPDLFAIDDRWLRAGKGGL